MEYVFHSTPEVSGGEPWRMCVAGGFLAMRRSWYELVSLWAYSISDAWLSVWHGKYPAELVVVWCSYFEDLALNGGAGLPPAIPAKGWLTREGDFYAGRRRPQPRVVDEGRHLVPSYLARQCLRWSMRATRGGILFIGQPAVRRLSGAHRLRLRYKGEVGSRLHARLLV